MSSIGRSSETPANRIVIGIIVALTTALAASAGDAARRDQLVIRYAAYELATPGAATALYRRINNEVKAYCEDRGILTVTRKRQEQACRTETLEKVVRELDDDRITAIHRGKAKHFA